MTANIVEALALAVRSEQPDSDDMEKAEISLSVSRSLLSSGSRPLSTRKIGKTYNRHNNNNNDDDSKKMCEWSLEIFVPFF